MCGAADIIICRQSQILYTHTTEIVSFTREAKIDRVVQMLVLATLQACILYSGDYPVLAQHKKIGEFETHYVNNSSDGIWQCNIHDCFGLPIAWSTRIRYGHQKKMKLITLSGPWSI